MKRPKIFIDPTARQPGLIDDNPFNFLRAAKPPRTPGKKRGPAKKRAILDAVEKIWNGNIPKTIMVKQRDEEIQRWIKSQGLPSVDARTIRRVLQDN